ncbi:MAG: YlxM family DNA-binding protein [Phascolarctobacterium sp.]|nr:YlxM family DNA-binding protein [Phascolarctobacterium sp.]
MSTEEIFEQRMRLGRLFDMYGGLLTEKQRTCLSLYFYDDLSLSEISEELGVSRQAVHDLLKRVEQILERYELALGILAKEEALHEELEQISQLLTACTQANNDEAARRLHKLCGENS